MWKKRYYSDVILRVGQPARDESRYSEICTVFITNGVAGFNLRLVSHARNNARDKNRHSRIGQLRRMNSATPPVTMLSRVRRMNSATPNMIQ